MNTQQAFSPLLPPGSRHGFFRTFPSEIRRNIYGLLYKEAETSYNGFDILATTPLVTVRLLSRQFKHEYDVRCSETEHTSQVLLKGTVSFVKDSDESANHVGMAALASHATNVTAALDACYCDFETFQASFEDTYLTFYRDWAWELAEQLPYLRWIRVHLTVPHFACAFTTTRYMSEIARHPKVENIDLCCTLVESGSNSKPLSTWTKQKGFKIDVEAIKQGLERAAIGSEQ